MSEPASPTVDRFQTRDEIVSFIEQQATVAVEKAVDEIGRASCRERV